MKNKIALMACTLLVLVAFGCYWLYKYSSAEETIKNIDQVVNDSTSYYRDLYHSEHATRQVVEADLTSSMAHYGALLDSIKKRTGIKDKDIQAVTAISTVTSGNITPVIDTLCDPDSTVSYSLSYQDDWIKLQGEISRTPTLAYLIKDSLIFTTFQKKVGLFRKETYIDGYSLNPAVHITGITGIKIVSEKPKRVGVGPYLGYGWNGAKWSPSAGISIHYSLAKF